MLENQEIRITNGLQIIYNLSTFININYTKLILLIFVTILTGNIDCVGSLLELKMLKTKEVLKNKKFKVKNLRNWNIEHETIERRI